MRRRAREEFKHEWVGLILGLVKSAELAATFCSLPRFVSSCLQEGCQGSRETCIDDFSAGNHVNVPSGAKAETDLFEDQGTRNAAYRSVAIFMAREVPARSIWPRDHGNLAIKSAAAPAMRSSA